MRWLFVEGGREERKTLQIGAWLWCGYMFMDLGTFEEDNIVFNFSLMVSFMDVAMQFSGKQYRNVFLLFSSRNLFFKKTKTLLGPASI